MNLFSAQKHPAAFLLALFLKCIVPLSAQVSPLEAVHVFEIYTGGVVDHIEKDEQEHAPFYRLLGHRGPTRIRASIDGQHGRLLSLEHQTNNAWNNVYQWPGIRVVAHRGGALLGPPENTIEAIEKAIAVGADLIEIDIRQTRDGHLVLMHDTTVDRTTNGKGPVADMTLKQVQALEVTHEGNGLIRVPTLQEALKVMKGRIDPDLDYKEGDLDLLIQIVRSMDMIDQSTMYGSWERCRQISEKEPRLRIRPTADFPLQVPQLARDLRPALINFDWHAVSEEAIRLAHLHGCHAFVNCLARADTAHYMTLAVDAGADYIQSDRPDLVVDYLKKRKLYRLSEKTDGISPTPLQSGRLGYPFR